MSTAKRQPRRKEKPASGNSPVGNSPAAKSSAGKPAAVSLSTRWIESFLDYSRSECHLSSNTVAAYRRDLRKFDEWLGGRKIQELSIRDLGEFAAWLNARGLAPASVARHLVALKVFFRYLQLEGVLKDNLAELLGSQKLWQRVPQVLSHEMIDKLLDAPRGTMCSGAAIAPCSNCSTPRAAARRKFPTCAATTYI